MCVFRPAAILLTLALAWSGPAVAACAGKSMLGDIEAGRPEVWKKSIAELQATPHAVGLFWKIEKDGIDPSWIFGTIHLPDPDVPALSPAIAEAFAHSDPLVIELAGVSGEGRKALADKLLPVAQLPEGQSFDASFTAEQKAALGEMTAAIGMPYFVARRMEPWFLAIALSTPPCAQLAMIQGDEGLDARLEKDATAAGKRVVGLESIDEQLATLTSLKGLVDGDSLLDIVRLGPDKIADLFATLLQSYVEERPLLDLLLTKNLPELKASGEIFSEMQTTFLHDRNARMRDRLLPVLNQGGAFIAVGALHLPGADGLIELLQASGYTVTRIQ